jgi:hypothetical protein
MANAQPTPGKIDVTILETLDIPSPDAQRLGKRDLLVVYAETDNARHAVRLPAESADEPTVARTIRADLDKRAKFAGRRLSV